MHWDSSTLTKQQIRKWLLKIDLADFCRIVNGHIAHTTSIVIANQILSEVTVNLKPDLTDMIEFCWG